MASSERVAEQRGAERVIAADRAVGVRPWSLGSFDTGTRKPMAAPKPAEPERVAASHLPTAEEVEAMEQQARAEGYAAGLAEARVENERFAAMMAGVDQSISRLERDMAGTLLQLAVDLARQVLRESISVRPELILPLVEEALAGIARGASVGALHLNPADLPLVEERMGEALAHAGWKAFADESIMRGGCRVKFEGGEVDATIDTRWDRVMSQLERDDAWLV